MQDDRSWIAKRNGQGTWQTNSTLSQQGKIKIMSDTIDNGVPIDLAALFTEEEKQPWSKIQIVILEMLFS